MTNITNLANTTDVNTLVKEAGYYTKIGAIKKKLDQDYGQKPSKKCLRT